MLGKIRQLLCKYMDIILYLVFGVLTTAVNLIVYAPLHYWCDLPASLSNGIAWVAAVVFAFLTNKKYVFKSNEWAASVVLPELGKFVASRVASGLFETLFIAITVDIMLQDAMLMKVISSIVVIVMNYIASRLFVFRKRTNG